MRASVLLKDLRQQDTSGRLTPQAIEEGLAVATPTKLGQDHYTWSWEANRRLLKENGHQQKCDPQNLSVPPLG